MNLQVLFENSLEYLTEAYKSISRSDLNIADLGQCSDLYNRMELHRNLDLRQCYLQLQSLPDEGNQEAITRAVNDCRVLIKKYREHKNSIFLVDEEFPYGHLSDAIRHCLAVSDFNESLLEDYPKLRQILVTEMTNQGIIHGMGYYPYFFVFDLSIFLKLGVKLNLLSTDNKERALPILQFLCDYKVFNSGDFVGEMSSRWVTTRSNTQRWARADFDVLIEGEQGSVRHYVEFVSNDQLIYMTSSGVGLSGESRTYLMKRLNGQWEIDKTLQRLIR